MRTISACLVLLLSFCAIVKTQSESNFTSSLPCMEQDQKTDTGISYRIKCGSCKNLTITVSSKISQTMAEVSMNSVCTNCTSGTATNKTCTLKASNANDTSFFADCFDYSTTCSTKFAKILPLPVMVALIAMASSVWHQ